MSKIIERVRRLQKLAESRDADGNIVNPHEAEAAAKKALELMREHALSQSQIDEAEAIRQDPLIEKRLHFDWLALIEPNAHAGPRPKYVAGWKRKLAFAVGEYLGLRAAFSPGTLAFWYYGHLTDVEHAIRLYGICARQIDRACTAWTREETARRKTEGKWFDPVTKADGIAFRESAVDGLEDKFGELKRESAVDHNEAHALVLNRAKKVDDWVNANFTFKKSSGEGQGQGGWNAAGYETGKKLKLTEEPGLPDHGGPKALEG